MQVGSLILSEKPRTNRASVRQSSDATSQATTTTPRTTTTADTTPVYSSPLESPSHSNPSSTGRHSRVSSSVTRFSGTLLRSSASLATSRSTAGAGAERKQHGGGGSGHKKKNKKKKKKKNKWQEMVGVIDEEAADEDDDETDEEEEDDEDEELEIPGWCAAILCALILVFVIVCLIVWGIARHYKPTVVVKNLIVHNFYAGEGTDLTGVPTTMVTLNSSLAMSVHNPSTMFGIHVSSKSIQLMYSEIAIATGQLDKFYQPKKSDHDAAAVLHGEKTPLYGAGATLAVAANDAAAGGKGKKQVPLTLELAVRTRGHVIMVTHTVDVTCPVAIDPGSSRPIRFRPSDCSYRRH